jgi:hypothetical protein
MSKSKVFYSLILLMSALMVYTGCPGGQKRIIPPGISSSAGADAMTQYDTNKDGKISGDELKKSPSINAAIEQIDKAKTGGVTADMITARIREWKDSKLAIMSVSCTVTRNGQPLEGADVKFVPEKFLGENLKVATGKSDANGQVMLSVEADPAKPNQPPGVAPGLYRVEITKASDNIPAKYNTETTLGQEIGPGYKGQQEGVKFDLTY